MVTIYTPELDFSTFPESDGAPMAESLENMTEMIFGMNFLMELQERTRYAVGGNQFLYYNQRNGKDHLAPDVYVALDVPPGLRSTWKTWVEDKCPDVVMEITSGSTRDEDLGRKLCQYGKLGAREYYIYDPLHMLQPPLRGYRYENQRPIPIPVSGDSITSPLLGAELRIVGMYLRVVDPRTGEPMLMTEEERRARIAAEREAAAERQARHMAEIRADAAEARADEEATIRQAAELDAAAERQARQAAEAKAADERQTRITADAQADRTARALQEALARLARLSEGSDPANPPV